MSSPNSPRLARLPRQFARLALAMALAGLTAGCFQPLYGSASDTRTASGTVGLADRLGSVEVLPIAAPNGTPIARLAVEVRNDLIFDLTGGGPTPPTAYKLNVTLTASTRQVIVDINSARPEIQNYGLNATYSLLDGVTGKTIFTSYTFARVSYNIPGQQQRFAGDRGRRDAENRAAKVISENIRARLASYFVAGT